LRFDPSNWSLKFWESTGTPSPKAGVALGMWGFTPSHFPTLLGVPDVTPGLPFGPHPCNPFALVASPKLGLRHSYCYRASMFGTPTSCASSSWFIYSSCVGIFSTVGCWVVSSNFLLTPFISTFDIFFFEPICYKSSVTLLCYSTGSS
jgi:hypothetical protein